MSEPLLSQLTIECALSALRVMHDSLSEPSAHFSVEVQRAHQVEILTAIRELTHLQQEQDTLAKSEQWQPLENGKHNRIAGRTSIEIRADMVILENSDSILTAALPDDIRLCRRKPPG